MNKNTTEIFAYFTRYMTAELWHSVVSISGITNNCAYNYTIVVVMYDLLSGQLGWLLKQSLDNWPPHWGNLLIILHNSLLWFTIEGVCMCSQCISKGINMMMSLHGITSPLWVSTSWLCPGLPQGQVSEWVTTPTKRTFRKSSKK